MSGAVRDSIRGSPSAPDAGLRALAAGLPSDRWSRWDIALWLAATLAYFAFPAHRVLGSQVIITILFALSLDLVLGYAGIVSLGHAAFFGLGAYTAGILSVHGWGEPLSGLVAAAVVAGVVGFLSSFLVVRGAALGQLMITLGVGLLLKEVANKADHWTGGVDGLTDMHMKPVLGAFDFDLAGNTAYLYSLVITLGAYLLLRRVVSSPFGLSLRAIREGAGRMPALGAPVNRRLVAAFTLAAVLAGVAGALLTQTTQFVGLSVLDFDRSAGVTIMLVLGGTGRLYGAFVGAGLFMLLQDFLARRDPVYWQLWLGVLLVAVVLIGRGGVLGIAETLRERGAQRRAR